MLYPAYEPACPMIGSEGQMGELHDRIRGTRSKNQEAFQLSYNVWLLIYWTVHILGACEARCSCYLPTYIVWFYLLSDKNWPTMFNC